MTEKSSEERTAEKCSPLAIRFPFSVLKTKFSGSESSSKCSSKSNNGVLSGRESVIRAWKKVDNPIMKIDAGSDELIRMMNKPVGTYRVQDIVRNLKQFEGNFILQTMFLRSEDFDLASADNMCGWTDIVRELKPREIMVYTIDRETPDKSLAKYTVDEMRALVQPLLDEGFNIQIRG